MPCESRQALSLAVCVLALALPVRIAGADGKLYTAQNEKWKAECGSCHVAYPPQLLPASSWQALMSGLDKHFGTDASLDPNSAAEIGTFLGRHAQKKRPSGKPVLRITESRWFNQAHDEVPTSLWQDPKVKSPANCSACHTRADNGDYRERTLRLPK